MRWLGLDVRHPVQSHRARETQHAARSVDNHEVISEMAPGQMDKREMVAVLWDVQSYVLAQIPLPSFVSREDFEVDFSSIWCDVGYTAILGPGNLPVALLIHLVHG